MLHATEDELIGQLRALVERGLLVEADDDEFHFRHALVRDSVLSQLLGRERRRLHEQALAALSEACCQDLAALARHAEGAGRFDQFVSLARDGSRHYLDAGSSYQALALATEALGEAPDDPVLLGVAAHAGWLLGLNAEALGHAEHWQAVVADADPVARARAARSAGRLYHELDRIDDVWRIVAEVEVLADEVPAGDERARCLAFVAQIKMLQDQNETAVELADAAIAEADAAGARAVRAQALVERASALIHMGDRRAEGRVAMQHAVAEARAVGDYVLVARGLNNLVDGLGYLDPEMPSVLAGMREAADRSGFDAMMADFLVMHTASWAIATGDAAAARRAIDRAAELGPMARRAVLVWQRGLQTHLALEAGELDAAEALLAQLRAAADTTPRKADADHWCAELSFRLACRRGDAGAANAVLRELPAPQDVDPAETVLDHVVLMLDGAARVAVDRALVDERLLTVVAPWLERLDGAGLIVDGMVAVLDSDPERAVERLTAGLSSPAAAVISAPPRALLGLALARRHPRPARCADPPAAQRGRHRR
jgi:hypothetical protein